jgi:uncharacterized protein YeaO (DUF488 family)
MANQFTRKSVGYVLRNPDLDTEFYVFVARYWPSGYEPEIGDDDCVFDRWDKQLAPSPSLIAEYDENEWAEWARKYVAEVGEDTILRRAAVHAEDAGDRDVVFVCYEGEEEFPRCHTWELLAVLEGRQQTALADFLQGANANEADAGDGHGETTDRFDPATCPNGYEWCPGPDGDTLPCFECFDPSKDYDGSPE